MSQASVLCSQGGISQFSTKRKLPWPLTELWVAKTEGPCFVFGCIHGTHLAHHRDELIHKMSISPKWEPRILMEVCGLPRPELRERLLQSSQNGFWTEASVLTRKREKERRISKRDGKKGRKEDERSFSRCGKSAFQFCFRCECARRVMMLTSLQLVVAKKLRDFGAGQGWGFSSVSPVGPDLPSGGANLLREAEVPSSPQTTESSQLLPPPVPRRRHIVKSQLRSSCWVHPKVRLIPQECSPCAEVFHSPQGPLLIFTSSSQQFQCCWVNIMHPGAWDHLPTLEVGCSPVFTRFSQCLDCHMFRMQRRAAVPAHGPGSHLQDHREGLA